MHKIEYPEKKISIEYRINIRYKFFIEHKNNIIEHKTKYLENIYLI